MMIIVLVLLVVVFSVVMLENRSPVAIEFLTWHFDSTLGVALIAAMAVGALIVFLATLGRQLSLRTQLRHAETRAHNAEAKIREAERQREMIITTEDS